MKELTKIITVNIGAMSDLSLGEQTLLKKAMKVRLNAYAPSPHYFVGAAVLSHGGNIYTGCNVERDTYTQTTHAEQNAIDTMVTQEGKYAAIRMLALADAPQKIVIPTVPQISYQQQNIEFENVSMPCGHCLVIIWQHCKNNPDVKIISIDKDGLVAIARIGDVYPCRFDLENDLK